MRNEFGSGVGQLPPESLAWARFRDRGIFGLMFAFQFVLIGMQLVPILTRQPGSSNPAINMLCSGWIILLIAHQRLRSRIANLEIRLAESKSANNF